jgi:hypothetical protein
MEDNGTEIPTPTDNGTEIPTPTGLSIGGCDDPSLRINSTGTWTKKTTFTTKGGQVMQFKVQNLAPTGTTITISVTNPFSESRSSNIGPFATVTLPSFSIFRSEPFDWTFSVSTEADAFSVLWVLCSTWIPGDPPNP